MAHINHFSEEMWRTVLEGGPHTAYIRPMRKVLGAIPTSPRCKMCNMPFGGVGGVISHMVGCGQFEKNPKFCRNCVFTGSGGAELEITMLFADVRGSTGLAEMMSATEFSKLMSRFYKTAGDVFLATDAWLDRLIGDEVIGLFIPGFAGPNHAKLAAKAAQKLLQATGHRRAGGPWVPVGAGVHTGSAYVGMVGAEGGVSDLTALGDSMNIAARLASQAKAGEILFSKASYTAAGLDPKRMELRQLQLKGRAEPVEVGALNVAPS